MWVVSRTVVSVIDPWSHVLIYILTKNLDKIMVDDCSQQVMSFNVLQFTVQLALEGLAEYVLHLTRLNPDMMYVHKDSGYISVSYFKFDIDEQTGKIRLSAKVPSLFCLWHFISKSVQKLLN